MAELRKQAFGKVKLSCVMFSQPLKHTTWPLGMFPTYCFDETSPILRFGAFDGSIQVVMNSIAQFRGRYVARDVAISDDTKQLLHIHLESLTSVPAKDVAIPEPPATPSVTGSGKVSAPASTMTGNKLGGPNPRYPAETKQRGIEGKVVLQAVIGTDGRVHRLRVVSSPDESLTVASVAAVERWVYRPYVVDGKPVQVETPIDVVFRLH